MKTAKILDVDFIGNQEGLTKEEELALSTFFSSKRQIPKKPRVSRIKQKVKA